MTSCSVQTKRTYRQHMEMSLFIYQFLSIQSSIMNSSSVVCKQCLLNISTIYLASRPISKYPYPNIWTRAEHLYSNVSLLLDQSNGNISFCRDLWKNISTFDPALINNETEYFHSFILFHSFDIELVNRKCRLSIHNNGSIKILLKNPINVFMKQFVELPQVALEMIFFNS